MSNPYKDEFYFRPRLIQKYWLQLLIFITHRIGDFDQPPLHQIVLICNSETLPENFEATLNYSIAWAKKNFKIGDKIKFKAKVKKSTYYYWIEILDKPADMIEPEEEIEIINIKQIVKI